VASWFGPLATQPAHPPANQKAVRELKTRVKVLGTKRR
jgi:hypothetical protein